MALETLALKAYQAEPDAPEVIEKLPVLKISDIDKKAEKVRYQREGNLIYTEADAKGIVYSKVMFSLDGLNEDELQFAALLTDVFGELSTESHSYSDLYDEILLNTGGVSFSIEPYSVRNEDRSAADMKGMLSADIRTLEEKLGCGFELAAEMISETILDDQERLMELLPEFRSHLQSRLDSASHTAAALRASSYLMKTARFSDLTSGIAYYDFLCAACRLTKEPVHRKRFIRSLKAVTEKIFRKENAVYTLYGSKAARKKLEELIPDFEKKLQDASDRRREEQETENREHPALTGGRELAPLSTLNEGLKTSSQVNYVARCGSFAEEGLPYTGVLKVLRVMLNYDYLWINLRVLGGAYGCMSGFARTGRAYLVSYRDPEIGKTNRIFEELPAYLDQWDGEESTVAKYIIGAISANDRPLTASDKAALSVLDCLFRTTDEELQQERDEILGCSAEQLRGCAAYIRALLKSGAICTIGNESQIGKEDSLFKSVRNLYS